VHEYSLGAAEDMVNVLRHKKSCPYNPSWSMFSLARRAVCARLYGTNASGLAE